MGPRYARFNGSAIGANLELLNGGRVVTTELGSLAPRTVLTTVPLENVDSYDEYIVYGSAGSITNLVVIGVATATVDLSDPLGEDDQGIGYNLTSGVIENNNGTIGSGASGALHSVVGVLVTWGSTPQVSFFVDGVLVDTVDVPASMLGEPLFGAVSIGSTTAGDIEVFYNSGFRRFEYPTEAAPGRFSFPAVGSDIYVSTRPYRSQPDDSPPNVPYEGRVAPTATVATRKLHFWPWGDDSVVQKSAFVVTLNNTDGRFDYMVGGSYRDLPMTLLAVDPINAIGAAFTFGTFVLDRVEMLDEGQARFTFVDDFVLLEKPAQRRFFRPDAQEQAKDRPWPTVIGGAFSVPLTQYDSDGLKYAVDSEGASFYGKVRDRGDPLIPTTDYTVTDNGTTVTLVNPPLGIVTADAASTGADYVPPAPVDLLGGIGNPFAGSVGSAPTGWTTAGAQPPEYAGGGVVEFPFDPNDLGNMTATGITTTASVTYLVRLVIDQMQNRVDTTNIGSRIAVGYTSNVFSGFIYFEPPPGTTYPHVIEEYIVAPGANAIYLTHQNSNQVGGVATHVSELTLTVIPTGDTSDPDDEIEAAQPALQLEPLIAEIFRRNAIPESFWDREDAEDLDLDTGYRGSGFQRTGQYTVREALNEILVGYSACMWKGRDGVMHLSRIVAPEEVVATGQDILKRQMLGELQVEYDAAPGLTTTVVCRRNGVVLNDADLVTDEVEVTLALRRKLAREFRFQRSSGIQLAAGYEHGEDAPPLETSLVDPADAQAEIERVATIYTKARAFYSVRLPLTETPPELGQIVTLYYDRYGLDAGVQMMVVEVALDLYNSEMRVVLWGLAPSELES